MKGSDKRIVDAADGGEYRAKSASDAVSKKHGRLDDQQSQISRERQRVAIVGKRKQLSDEGIAHRRVKFGEGKPNLIRDGMVFVRHCSHGLVITATLEQVLGSQKQK